MPETTLLFDESESKYYKDHQPPDDISFVCTRLLYLDKLIHEEGYLCINDVRACLGLGPTSYGQINGWIYSRKDGWIGPDDEKEYKFAYRVAIRYDSVEVTLYNAWEMHTKLLPFLMYDEYSRE